MCHDPLCVWVCVCVAGGSSNHLHWFILATTSPRARATDCFALTVFTHTQSPLDSLAKRCVRHRPAYKPQINHPAVSTASRTNCSPASHLFLVLPDANYSTTSLKCEGCLVTVLGESCNFLFFKKFSQGMKAVTNGWLTAPVERK